MGTPEGMTPMANAEPPGSSDELATARRGRIFGTAVMGPGAGGANGVNGGVQGRYGPYGPGRPPPPRVLTERH